MRSKLETELPAGIRRRVVREVNGLDMHVLEAGPGRPDAPVLLLLHGFPELAFSWRHVMLPLAAAGYRVLAPDQRGYGRTTGWDDRYDGDLASFRLLNLVRDAVGLLAALGIREVAGVFGHDFGASVAGWCAMLRPDIFRSVAIMSAPFAGAPALAQDTERAPMSLEARLPPVLRIAPALAALDPPRKHYHTYYATREANRDMMASPQGLRAFLRAYFHQKSADWAGNAIHRLSGWTAQELAKLPRYYVMDLDRTMAECVAETMPTAQEIAACGWLSEAEMAVYTQEYARTGFQGGLNWYRARLDPRLAAEHELFSGVRIAVPATFIAGASDWGVHQMPGALERMEGQVCTDYRGTHLVPGAGHWVQQEQPAATVRLLLAFLEGHQAAYCQQ
ncbi:MAG: alpha/beta fold hydrolase [Hyphomicrobiaceae bacterium]